MPAVACQPIAYAGDHIIQTANIGVDVEVQLRRQQGWIDRGRRKRQAQPSGALLHDPGHMLLYIAAQTAPTLPSPAQRDQVMEVWLAPCKSLKFLVVVKLALVAGAVDQPDFLALATVGTILGKQPLRKAAHWRH